MSYTASAPGLGPSERFALIIEGLCGAVAARAPGNLVAAPLLVLLWSRLRRLSARFARLVTLAAAGTMPVPRVRVAGKARGPRTGTRWPSGFAWLVRLVPEAAGYGSQLQYLLSQPDMVELIAAVPQVGRMFGPLGRMLAVQTATSLPKPAKCLVAPKALPRVRPAVGPAAPVTSYWGRIAWPGHDFDGLVPPKRGPPARGVDAKTPAVDRSG